MIIKAVRRRASGVFLSTCAIALAWWSLRDAQAPAAGAAPGTGELLQGSWREDGGHRLSSLASASAALGRKSAILNRLLVREAQRHLKSSAGAQQLGSDHATQALGETGGQLDMRALIHEGATLRQLRRALESKARLLAKFSKEASGAGGGAERKSELAQLPQRTPALAGTPAEKTSEASSTSPDALGDTETDAEGHGILYDTHNPYTSAPAASTAEDTAAYTASTAEDAAGPLEKKKLLLNDILDREADNLGPEESDSYHAPETANLQDQIADIKYLAKQENVLLPPLTPNSRVVHGERALFAAHIEGKVVNAVDGSPVAGATVELVGPSKPLPPNMIEQVAGDGPLHAEVDKTLRSLARGFAVIGLKTQKVGSLQGETDRNGNFKLVAAPGIYAVLGDKQNYDPSHSLERLCSPDHVTHVRVLMNPFLPRGTIRIVLTWGERWWNPDAQIADLELVVQTPSGCLIRLGSPETEIEPQLGPELDSICSEKVTQSEPLASDIRHGGPVTIELKSLEPGRYWVTVNERSRAAGGFDVTTMEFPLCSTILESSDAEVSVFTGEGGRQRFSVQKDGDVYGKGRCSWDVVGIDGRTQELHSVYPEGHDQKPKPIVDPYAKFDVDNSGNKIMQVPPAPMGVGIGGQGNTWPEPPDNILMNAQPGPYVEAPENIIQGNSHTPGAAVQVSNKKADESHINWPSKHAPHIDEDGWRIDEKQRPAGHDVQNDVIRGWHERGGLGGGTKEWGSGDREKQTRRARGQRPRYLRRKDERQRRDIDDRQDWRSTESDEHTVYRREHRGRENREYEWPDQPGRALPTSHTPQDYDTWDREQWTRQRRPPVLIRPMWNPLTDFIPRDSAAFYAGTGGISVYPFKGMPALQLSVTMWITTDTLQSAGPTEESLTLQESEMEARDLMIWVAGHGQRTGVQIADGYWHFIAVTWSSFDGATFLYVDGMLMWSAIMAKGMAIGDGGSLIFGQDQSIQNAFEGQLADIALWNKPLGLDDVRAQINNEQGRDVTGLLMRLKFKEPSQAIRERGVELWKEVVPDVSGFHHDAVRVGIPLPTMMHKRVAVAGAPPSNVVISKNETDQADGKKKAQDRSSLSIKKQEDIHHNAAAQERAQDTKESVSLKRDASEMFVKSDAMSSEIRNEDRVKKIRDEYAALKKEEAEATPHATPHATKDSHVTQGYNRRGEKETKGENQATKVRKEGGWGQVSRVGAGRAVDPRSGTEEQGRKLVREIFPDRLGPN